LTSSARGDVICRSRLLLLLVLLNADDVIESHAHARLNSFDPLGDVYVTLLVSFMQVSFR